MVSNPASNLSLGFIGDDVRNQLSNSRSILEIAAQLQDVLTRIGDAETQGVVQQAIQRLLAVASNMTSNAAMTTSTATVTISGISYPYKK